MSLGEGDTSFLTLLRDQREEEKPPASLRLRTNRQSEIGSGLCSQWGKTVDLTKTINRQNRKMSSAGSVVPWRGTKGGGRWENEALRPLREQLKGHTDQHGPAVSMTGANAQGKLILLAKERQWHWATKPECFSPPERGICIQLRMWNSVLLYKY
jgi:hypothetical protein